MPDFLNRLFTEAAALSWIDWTATLTALLYVMLAARDNAWCWFWGMISCSLWAYSSFVFYQLYLDALLQLFYVGMAFVGLYQWRYGGRGGAPLPITGISWRQHLYIWAAGGVLTVLCGYFFAAYTAAAATYLDAFTTVFSVFATFLLVRRKLENWLYWVVTDALYVGLYFSRGAYLYALLMVVYTVIAAVAYLNWRKLADQQPIASKPEREGPPY